MANTGSSPRPPPPCARPSARGRSAAAPGRSGPRATARTPRPPPRPGPGPARAQAPPRTPPTQSAGASPPPRLSAEASRRWCAALRSVNSASSRHRLSRSVRSGNRPASALRQKLSNALSATSSSSEARRAVLRSRVRASPTSRWKYFSHSGARGRRLPGLELVQPDGDGVGWHGRAGRGYESLIIPRPSREGTTNPGSRAAWCGCLIGGDAEPSADGITNYGIRKSDPDRAPSGIPLVSRGSMTRPTRRNGNNPMEDERCET